MDRIAEILIQPEMLPRAQTMLHALHRAIPGSAVVSTYTGAAEWLILYGVGAPERDAARKKHIARGGHVLIWDMGYFERKRFLRCSIDRDHPQDYLDLTAPNPGRWERFHIPLRSDGDPNGHILLVGLGRKTWNYLKTSDWEVSRLAALRKRFPRRRVIYRPKPNGPALRLLDCETDQVSPIDDLLKGCALVYSRHSNVLVEAAIAGVPIECEDGAAQWLARRAFTYEHRLDFLRRLAWWQWEATEMALAWSFIQQVTMTQGVKIA